MSRPNIDTGDRLSIYENLTRYAWSLDQADGEGVAATFTEDGRIEAPGDRVFENHDGLLDFVKQASSREGFFGRQHHVQPIMLEPADDGYLLTAYWTVVTWHAGAPPFIVSLGRYNDHCVKVGDTWLTKKKIIAHWNDTTVPPMNHPQP